MGYFMVNILKNGLYFFLLTIKRFLRVVACIDGDNNNSALCFCHAFRIFQLSPAGHNETLRDSEYVHGPCTMNQ